MSQPTQTTDQYREAIAQKCGMPYPPPVATVQRARHLHTQRGQWTEGEEREYWRLKDAYPWIAAYEISNEKNNWATIGNTAPLWMTLEVFGPQRQAERAGLPKRDRIASRAAAFEPKGHTRPDLYLPLVTQSFRWFDLWQRGELKREDKDGLCLWGNVGGGKTFILAAMAKELSERGVVYGWMQADEWTERIKASYNGQGDETAEDIFDSAAEAPVLFIDDLGAERHTEHNHDLIERLLFQRHSTIRTTFITTNLTQAKELPARVGERIDSRLQQMVQFIGPFPKYDWRRAEGRSAA